MFAWQAPDTQKAECVVGQVSACWQTILTGAVLTSCESPLACADISELVSSNKSSSRLCHEVTSATCHTHDKMCSSEILFFSESWSYLEVRMNLGEKEHFSLSSVNNKMLTCVNTNAAILTFSEFESFSYRAVLV